MDDEAPTISSRFGVVIAALAVAGIILSLIGWWFEIPLLVRPPLIIAVCVGGAPIVFDLVRKALHRDFGADFLAAISIVTAILLDEWLAAALVVLMLSGGAVLEQYAVRKASSVLEALAKRMPSVAHRRKRNAEASPEIEDIPSDQVQIGDEIEVYPHEICPVDGRVISGSGTMDESFLTGEPYEIEKTPGCEVISGAVNGNSLLVIEAVRKAVDSRYARIVAVMGRSKQLRPRMRRVGDMLGGWYTPVAVIIALVAWVLSGDPVRFLAVLVVATPCPLLIAIPVSIIGAISLCARRGIIIKDPVVLERVSRCRTVVLDKTGTLTFGRPRLDSIFTLAGWSEDEVLALTASIERYSRHPLAKPILEAAASKGIPLREVERAEEQPGRGLEATVGGRRVTLTSRKGALASSNFSDIPPSEGGLEAVLLVEGVVAAVLHFLDEPRGESASFVEHLGRLHGIQKVILLSGDREEEVRRLAAHVGITQTISSASPEDKVDVVRRETAMAETIFFGDGINDAPALAVASVGVAFGGRSEITGEAAGAVLLDPSLHAADELLHIGAHMRRIALQSALGGMALSVAGMVAAAFGFLTPVAGAVVQEGIDLVAVLNALRASRAPKVLADMPME